MSASTSRESATDSQVVANANDRPQERSIRFPLLTILAFGRFLGGAPLCDEFDESLDETLRKKETQKLREKPLGTGGLTESPPFAAPSISSTTIQVGLAVLVDTESSFCRCSRAFHPRLKLVLSSAFRTRSSTTRAVRSSEAFTSCTWYPAWRASTCANVVFPRPGGPDRSRILVSKSQDTAHSSRKRSLTFS